MARPKTFKKQYLWVSQDFYKLIMDTSQDLQKKGYKTGTAHLTHQLAPIIKDNVKFEMMFVKPKWRRRR